MHNYTFAIALLLILSLISCQNDVVQDDNTYEPTKIDSVNINLSQYAAVEHLVNPDQLQIWQNDNNIHVILIDVRKKVDYNKGHLVEAHQVWRPDIRSTEYPYSGMILEQEALEGLIGSLGATSQSRIVLYDAKGNADAVRLWWMLAVYGHENAYILNGGILNIKADNITQDSTIASPTKFAFTGQKRQDLVATKEAVIKALEDDNTIILDCRTPDEFTGKSLKKGAFRAGHIPDVINIEHSEAIAYERQCTFRDYADLEQRFKAIPKDKNIIVYCQSGVRSAHTTFVLRELLGYANVSNYDGSWIEWSYYKNLPIIKRADPSLNL